MQGVVKLRTLRQESRPRIGGKHIRMDIWIKSQPSLLSTLSHDVQQGTLAGSSHLVMGLDDLDRDFKPSVFKCCILVGRHTPTLLISGPDDKGCRMT